MNALCPFCRKKPSAPLVPGGKRIFPFCSERCKEADLGNWASEKYRMPAKALEEEDLMDIPMGEEDFPLGEDGDE